MALDNCHTSICVDRADNPPSDIIIIKSKRTLLDCNLKLFMLKNLNISARSCLMRLKIN